MPFASFPGPVSNRAFSFLILIVLAVAALLQIACGGGGSNQTASTPALNPTAPPPSGGTGTTSGGSGTTTTGTGTTGSGTSTGGTTGGTGGSGGGTTGGSTGGSGSSAQVTISLPANGLTVTSPVEFKAKAQMQNLDHVRLFVDGQSLFFTFFDNFDVPVFIAPGAHNIKVQAFDKSGNTAESSLQLTVSSESLPYTFANMQNMQGWEWCTAHLRGQECASGLGDATSAMTPGQSQPALSGSSARFDIGGPTGYSNALWWRSLGGGNVPSHFTYDLYFYTDHPELSQALEFDANQSFGGQRFIWGTECNYKDTKRWDIWDPEHSKWIPTTIPCDVPAGSVWHHLVWNFERDTGRVHYISLILDNQTIPVDIWYNSQPNWQMEDIDIAFQMDGDFAQHAYSVWLDKVNLTAW